MKYIPLNKSFLIEIDKVIYKGNYGYRYFSPFLGLPSSFDLYLYMAERKYVNLHLFKIPYWSWYKDFKLKLDYSDNIEYVESTKCILKSKIKKHCEQYLEEYENHSKLSKFLNSNKNTKTLIDYSKKIIIK